MHSAYSPVRFNAVLLLFITKCRRTYCIVNSCLKIRRVGLLRKFQVCKVGFSASRHNVWFIQRSELALAEVLWSPTNLSGKTFFRVRTCWIFRQQVLVGVEMRMWIELIAVVG